MRRISPVALGLSLSSIISSAELTTHTNLSPNNCRLKPLALSHSRPEFHQKPQDRKRQVEQKRHPCSARALAHLPPRWWEAEVGAGMP